MNEVATKSNKLLYQRGIDSTTTINNRIAIFETERIYSLNVSVHKTTTTSFTNSYPIDHEKLLFMSFINQRKVHRYYKAVTEHELKQIDDDQLEKIEDSCVLLLKNSIETKVEAKLLYFYNLMQKYAPEEIEFMNNEDLAELLSVSENKINKIHYKLENVC